MNYYTKNFDNYIMPDLHVKLYILCKIITDKENLLTCDILDIV